MRAASAMACASSALTASGFSIITGTPMTGADFHHLPVIIGIGVGQDGLRMSLLQHVFEISEEQAAVEIELRRVARRDLLVGLGNSDNLDVAAME